MGSFLETYNDPSKIGGEEGVNGGFATCKGIRIPESEKIFLLESRI